MLEGLQRVAARAAFVGAAGGRVVGTPLHGLFPVCPGSAAFEGVVDVITTPAPNRVVRLHERSSGKLVRETVTDAAGRYSFPNLDSRRSYYIVALDTQPGGLNAAVADYLTPT